MALLVWYAGTTVLVSPWVMHRNAQQWPQPEAFLPERWLPLLQGRPAMAELSGMGSSGTYLPFGAGPRNCIGTGATSVLCRYLT
jgi:cytochrome P450